MADRTVKVTLTAQAQGYIAEMEKAAQATRKTGTEAEQLAQKAQAFETMGRSAMVAGGAIAAGLLLSTKAAIDWDSAWAGVTKTVDGSPEQLAEVEAGLRGLSSVLPASHDEIAAVAEAAGQLGIKTPEVVGFTKTMIDLGETTNLSSEQAATSLARFMTVMGTSQSEVSGLGSALVELGNNYATTEAEIMEMSMRLAGAGNQIGMSEGQVLGLSTALSSVGIEAEAGGSAMSKVMIDIASSAEKGGERIEKFAEVAGMSATDFTAKWKKDPGEALATFVKGLANAESQGKSTFGILEELGITEVRMRDALLRSASAADQFSEAMATGNEAMGENTALTAEAEKRYDTTAAKLDIMRNRVVDAAISYGENFLPAIEAVAEGVGTFAEMLAGLDGPMGSVVAWGGVLASGILLTGGIALAAVPKIAAYKVALETLGVNTSVLTGRLKNVGAFLTGPWGVALAAAAWGVYELNKVIKDGVPTSEELKNALLTSADAADALAKAGERSGAEKFFMGDYAKNLEDLAGVFERTGETANNFFSHALAGTQNRDIGALGVLDDLGKALAEIAASDLPAAQNAFRDLAESQSLTEAETATLLTRMPALKEALVGQATELELAADDSTLLALAMGEIGPAADEAGEGVKSSAAQYVEATDKANALAAELMSLLDAYNELNGIGQSAEQSNAKLQESYASLQEYVANAQAGAEGYALSLDASTEAGSANRAMLADHAAAVEDSAKKQFELESSTLGAAEAAANYEDRLSSGRQQIYDTALALTGNAEAAQELTDKVLSMPTEAEIEVLMETLEAKEQVESLRAQVDELPSDKKIFVDAETADALDGLDGVSVVQVDDKTFAVVGNTDDATAKIADVVANNPPDKLLKIDADNAKAYAGIDGVNVRVVDKKTAVVWGDNADAIKKIDDVNAKNPDQKTVWIGANDSGFRGVWESIMSLGPIQKVVNFVTGTKPDPNANGGIYAYANGDIAAYADGGFATGIYKGGAPIHKFAEPETGWEAYISGKPSERDRNRQIWADTGERLGMSGAGQATVYVPTSLKVYDADNRFIGTMGVVADQKIDASLEQQARENRRDGV